MHSGFLSVFLSPFLLLLPASLLWTGGGGSAKSRDGGSVEIASNMSAEALEKEEVQQKEHKKRKRDWAESGEDALVPHEPLARVMRRALKPSTNLERAAVKIMQVLLLTTCTLVPCFCSSGQL